MCVPKLISITASYNHHHHHLPPPHDYQQQHLEEKNILRAWSPDSPKHRKTGSLKAHCQWSLYFKQNNVCWVQSTYSVTVFFLSSPVVRVQQRQRDTQDHNCHTVRRTSEEAIKCPENTLFVFSKSSCTIIRQWRSNLQTNLLQVFWWAKNCCKINTTRAAKTNNKSNNQATTKNKNKQNWRGSKRRRQSNAKTNVTEQDKKSRPWKGERESEETGDWSSETDRDWQTDRRHRLCYSETPTCRTFLWKFPLASLFGKYQEPIWQQRWEKGSSCLRIVVMLAHARLNCLNRPTMGRRSKNLEGDAGWTVPSVGASEA